MERRRVKVLAIGKDKSMGELPMGRLLGRYIRDILSLLPRMIDPTRQTCIQEQSSKFFKQILSDLGKIVFRLRVKIRERHLARATVAKRRGENLGIFWGDMNLSYSLSKGLYKHPNDCTNYPERLFR